MPRTLRYLIVVVVAAAAGIGAWRYLRGAKAPTLKYDTAKVERGRLVARVTATGTSSALVTVLVGAQVSGRIAQLFADFNSPVKKGQTIARIDTALFNAAVEQGRANKLAAEGNLAKSRAQAVDARRQADRAVELRKQNLIAQADADTAAANAAAADAQVTASLGAVEQARASLHQAEINLAYTTIVSPIDGTVISRSVDVGQTVAAALQAPTLFTIAQDLTLMQVDTNVAESDVGKLTPGAPASFTVDAYPNERFNGTIRQIRNAPQTVQNVVTYDAVIDVKNPDLKLKPGMTANVTFVYAEKEGVLKVPNSAMRFRPPADLLAATARDGGVPADGSRGGAGSGAGGRGPGGRGGAQRGPTDRRTVWVLRNAGTPQAAPEPVQIRVGFTDGSFSEVLEGEVREGDLLVTDVTGGSTAPGATPTGGPPGGGMPRRLF